jgi:hypothetical protein
MAAALPPTPTAVPKSYEWYVEGAKWLVAIIAAVLAFGMSSLQAHPGDPTSLILFAVTASVLVVAGGFALTYLLQSYYYAGLRESAPEKVDEARAVKRICDRAFTGLIWSFSVGMIFFLLFGAAQLWSLRVGEDERLEVYPLSARSVCAQAVVRDGAALWLLERCSSAAPTWQRLNGPPAG